jgi:hypothetical protein
VAPVLLDYDRSIAPQETGYWCGPASTQMVLNNHGIIRSEADLARRMGTHTGGTDHIGLPARVLNEELGGGYIVRTIPNDPPTAVQKTLLWDDIRRSINAGYGIVANIVAPPSNYPRGVNGSVSPAYGGGTVYHYIALMGYDADTKAVWVADSGFRPFGYWISLDQLASLIPPKGYACKPEGSLLVSHPASSSRGASFVNSEGITVDEATYLHWTDKRLISIEDQLTRKWPQLGGRDVKEALAAIMEAVNGR